MPPPRHAFPSDDWLEKAKRCAPELTHDQVDKLIRFRDGILHTNEHTNLTAIRDQEGIDYRLVLESLRLAPFVRTFVDRFEGTTRLVDVGSGAGIPGLPLAIVFPDIEVALIEATVKKARFIEESVRELELPNATVTHGRSEAIARDPAWRETMQIATARAVGSLSTLLELTMPLLGPGGHAIFPKGELEASEVSAAARTAELVGAKLVDIVPLEAIEGCPATQVVLADKIAPITDRYPRRSGLPARDPLGG